MSKNEMPKKGFNLRGLTNTLKNTFDKEEEIYDEMLDEEYAENMSDAGNQDKMALKRSKSADKTLHIFKPRNKEEDVAEIITQLRDGSPCVINVAELPEEEAKRIIDNISGAAFALMGSGVPIAKGIYAFTPKTFAVNDFNLGVVPQKDILLSKVSK